MNTQNLENKLKSTIRDIPDFPKSGIIFKDLTPIFKSNNLFNEIVDSIFSYYQNKGITKVVGIESRGFITASVIANKLNAGFIPIRKPGKLPYGTYKQKYALEYGFDEIEIHMDALESSDIVLLHDDLLATGGTINAAIQLIERFKVEKIYINLICELEFLKGRRNISNDFDIFSLVKFS